MRSKRRCVLEKKQPYSGDEWCSGPDTEDEDKPHTTIIREFVSFHCERNVSPFVTTLMYLSSHQQCPRVTLIVLEFRNAFVHFKSTLELNLFPNNTLFQNH